MNIDIKLFLRVFSTLIFLSAGTYIYVLGIIAEDFVFWLIGCAGLSLGIIGLINIGRLLRKEEAK